MLTFGSVFPLKSSDPSFATDLKKKLETLQPKPNSWFANIHYYVGQKVGTNEHREVYLMHFDNIPKKHFILCRGVIVETEGETQAIIDRLKIAQPKFAISITVLSSTSFIFN